MLSYGLWLLIEIKSLLYDHDSLRVKNSLEGENTTGLISMFHNITLSKVKEKVVKVML